ncbi:GNAT family N-acetyltransferase [Qipengyuania sp. MTN3-11]|uniref:GNAT family N-acetyltransferase n=1 Tax=Qipengyuania sp. MTN3-11 TaxID=3056557 RepID=UPI0036F3DF6F
MFHVTPRLLLRPAWPEDAEAIHLGIADRGGDRGIVRNLASAPWPYSLDDARAFVKRVQDPRLPSFLVTLPGPGGSQVIGGAGLGEDENGVELGYWIARKFWGRGYATEAARGVLDVARSLGHERLVACHFLDNPASGKVLRKIGFRPTGRVVKRFSCGRGEESDCVELTIDLSPARAQELPLQAA